MLCTPHQIKKYEIGGACSTYGETRGACGVLVGKPEGKNHFGRPWRRWEDSIYNNGSDKCTRLY